MNIYFCGSMTGSQEKMNDYKEIIELLEKHGNVLNKFVGEKIIDTEPSHIYTRDTNNLKIADVMIADVTIPSTGVGFELGYTDNLNIPTLIIYDDTKKMPSALVLGNNKYEVKPYKTLDEAKIIVENYLKNKCS